jgi:hypothetical protein
MWLLFIPNLTMGASSGTAPVGPMLASVDPRGGTILSPDTDPLAVNPRQGTILN